MIKININKARNITHDVRRLARACEFRPWDDIIARQVPGQDLDRAEGARQEIRDRYAQIQTQIDQIQDLGQLKKTFEDLQKTVDKV